ncbi:MAG: MBOAT family protein [Oscillospiraceae bacterium]|nr:MBOAT family protein [Oscillospiraceae bacterium]
MPFNSLSFLVFFPLVCVLAALTNAAPFRAMEREKRMRIRQILLLIASYVFYGWWNWKCCFLMLGLTLTAHFCALHMDGRRRRLALSVGVVLPLLILGIFKYFNFFVDSFCALFGIARAGTLSILLPVGISFYTFQSLSYTIDVSRGKLRPETDFVKTALYIAFFPQLVAGPIVKAGDFIPQLHEERTVTAEGLALGVQYFAFGLFKKIVLADNIGVFVDAVHAAPAAYSSPTLLLMAYAYAIQIYCDFSGYSDMAVGCARILGYELPRNFNLPYLSRNVSEFWKRWHISLGAWLQDYLYIPLGGNRKGKARTYVNLLITMTVGGLWHGAAWTYVAWGALHGAALCVHKLYATWRKKRGLDRRGPLWTAVSVFVTFTWVSLCLVVFRADSIGKAFSIIAAIFTLQSGLHFVSFWAVTALILTALCSLAAILRSRKNGARLDGYYPTVDLSGFRGLTAFFTFVGLTLCLAYTGQSPFIYFQF